MSSIMYYGGLAVVVALLFSGCVTSTGNVIKDAAQVRGAAIADESLANAKWFVCKGATVGSVIREYDLAGVGPGGTWREFCE